MELLSLPFCPRKTNPRYKTILRIVIKIEDPIPFCSHLSLQTSLCPSTHPISTPEQPCLSPDSPVQPEPHYDLGPGPPLPSQSKGREARILTSRQADCRGLRVHAGSAGGDGQGSEPQDRSSARAGTAGSGETHGRKNAGGGDEAGQPAGRRRHLPGRRKGCTPPRGLRKPARPPGSPGLTPSSAMAPYYR